MNKKDVKKIVSLNIKIEALKANLNGLGKEMENHLVALENEYLAGEDFLDGVEISEYEKTASIKWKTEMKKRVSEAVMKGIARRAGTDSWLSISVNGLNFQRKMKKKE